MAQEGTTPPLSAPVPFLSPAAIGPFPRRSLAELLDAETQARLAAICRQVRRHILRMTAAAGSGHPGGSLSAVEILTTLYFGIMRHDPTNPRWPLRDRFILSKGHAAPALYAVLAEAGYFPPELLLTLRKLGSPLQGHVSYNLDIGVEASSGSLGQGFSVGVGMALAGRLDGLDYRVYVLLGDGELDEGQVWEAALAAAHYRLDNLTAIVDANGIQNDDFVARTLNLEPLPAKWAAFGWRVLEVDGHDLAELARALDAARAIRTRPAVVIARTVKGKGVSFMEHNPEFHGRAPRPDELERALAELAEEGP